MGGTLHLPNGFSVTLHCFYCLHTLFQNYPSLLALSLSFSFNKKQAFWFENCVMCFFRALCVISTDVSLGLSKGETGWLQKVRVALSCSFSHSLLLGTLCMPGTVLDTGDLMIKKNRILNLLELQFLVKKTFSLLLWFCGLRFKVIGGTQNWRGTRASWKYFRPMIIILELHVFGA